MTQALIGTAVPPLVPQIKQFFYQSFGTLRRSGPKGDLMTVLIRTRKAKVRHCGLRWGVGVEASDHSAPDQAGLHAAGAEWVT